MLQPVRRVISHSGFPGGKYPNLVHDCALRLNGANPSAAVFLLFSFFLSLSLSLPPLFLDGLDVFVTREVWLKRTGSGVVIQSPMG